VLSGRTRLVGLIGDPVAGSLSPRMQNAAFAARGLDWAYVPLPVAADGLEAALGGLAPLGFAGANVTVPHKTAVLAFCDEIDAFAERAGSANTLVVLDGRLHASSTDGLAVVGAVDVSAARVLLLGAGGAAQAVAAALADAGADAIRVAARDPEQGRALAARLQTVSPGRNIASAASWPPEVDDATLIINATPVRDEVLVRLDPGRQVVDLAYRPDGAPTALVEAARLAGCRAVVDGLEILVRQGAASFERWTGVTAPVDVMRAAVGSNGG
jgi:shikimate dehydrogenase